MSNKRETYEEHMTTWPTSFSYEGMALWEEDIENLKNILRGVPPGSFLSSVLENNLQAACAAADSINIQRIPVYVAFMYNYFPAGTWGYQGALEQIKKEVQINGHQ